MTGKRYTLFQTLMQRMASSPLGAKICAGSLHHLDRLFFRLSGGKMTLTSLLTGVPLVVVTTTGARSGLRRMVPLLCIQDGCDPGCFALIATNFGQKHYPGWYFNLKAHPRAECTIQGKAGDYLAREAVEEEYTRLWQAATATYAGYALYKQRIRGRGIPIMVMSPVSA